jgi:hypothetical protein
MTKSPRAITELYLSFKVDPLLDDQPRQSRRVERHRNRILGRGGERRQHAADRLQFGRQPAAFRRDQSARAGLHQGGGDVDRRALGAAGVEPRNDLQNRASGEGAALGAAEGRERGGAHAPHRARWSRAAPPALTAAAASAMPAGRKGLKPGRIMGSI